MSWRRRLVGDLTRLVRAGARGASAGRHGGAQRLALEPPLWAAARTRWHGARSAAVPGGRRARRLLQTEARVGDGYQKGQVDSSTEIVFELPFGHDSNDELAQKLGIFRVFEYEDSGRVSRITVAFQSRASLPAEVQSVEAHMALDNVNKLKQIPDGDVRGVKFPDDVTRHFRDLQVPFAAEIFASRTEGVSDTLVFGFETPGGFWTIGWHVPEELFTKEPDLFFLFLQALRMSPRETEPKAT